MGADNLLPADIAQMTSMVDQSAISPLNRGLVALRLSYLQPEQRQYWAHKAVTALSDHLAISARDNQQWQQQFQSEDAATWHAFGQAWQQVGLDVSQASAPAPSGSLSSGSLPSSAQSSDQQDAVETLASQPSNDALTVQRDEAFTLAAEAFRLAGNHDVFAAQRAYLAVSQYISPQQSVDAGLQSIQWDWLNAAGYASVLANYPASKLWQHPLHLSLWIVLLVLPLVLAFRSFRRRQRHRITDRFTQEPDMRPSTQAVRRKPNQKHS